MAVDDEDEDEICTPIVQKAEIFPSGFMTTASLSCSRSVVVEEAEPDIEKKGFPEIHSPLKACLSQMSVAPFSQVSTVGK